jgi:hypothetical protein
LQRDVFFYYHTRRETTESGIQQLLPLGDEAANFRHEDGRKLNAEEFEAVVLSMPENLRLSEDRKYIWAVQFLAHNGFKHGNRGNIRAAIQKDMEENPSVSLWDGFIKAYPSLANTYRAVQEAIAKREEDFARLPAEKPLKKDKKSSNHGSAPHSMGSRTHPDGVAKPSSEIDSDIDILSFGKSENLFFEPEAEKEFERMWREFLKMRAGKGKENSREAVRLLKAELEDLAKGKGSYAQRIVEQSIKRGYVTLYPVDGYREPEKSEKEVKRERKKQVTRAVKASRFDDEASAVDEFVRGMSRPPGREEIYGTECEHFCRWLESFHTPWSAGLKKELGELLEQNAISRLEDLRPGLTGAEVLEAMEDGNGHEHKGDSLLAVLLGENKRQPHALLTKAKKTALTEEEYGQVPFHLKDQLRREKNGYVFKT